MSRKRTFTLGILGKDHVVDVYEGGIPGEDLCGHCHPVEMTVAVSGNQAPEQAVDTLIHECIHLIDYGMAIGLDERQVHTLGSGMFQLLNGNPYLLQLIANPHLIKKQMK